jgi:integrase
VANAQLQPAAPSTVFGTVATPRRKPNAELRPREYLTEAEVERLRKAACAGNRSGHRDETMILIAFRHGLRASELVTLRWDAIEHPTLAQAQPIKPLDGVS